MKLPLPFPGRRLREPLLCLILALSVLGVSCADPVRPELVDMASTPRGPVPAGTPAAPEPGAVFGAPGDGISVSTPVENDGPGATETNFLTPPCGGGSRLIPDAGASDAGAPADAGAPDSPADAGEAPPAVDGGGARRPC